MAPIAISPKPIPSCTVGMSPKKIKPQNAANPKDEVSKILAIGVGVC